MNNTAVIIANCSATINEQTMSEEADLLGAFEEHSPEGIRKLLNAVSAQLSQSRASVQLIC
jgi:hypothetical protein